MFEMKYRVPYYDTDKMQVVHHANYIKYFELARTEYLRDAGFAYSEMEKYQLQVPVLGISSKYHEPAVYDEMVTISCRMAKLGPASMEFEYEVRNAETGALHVTGSSRHGIVNSEYKPAALKRNYPEVYKFLTELYEKDK
ncbi:MAG: acyl-CoA thioesterase [Firmicutes bacterium]|nr:acyl-CoA thioesterase [Bacillota bacterium]